MLNTAVTAMLNFLLLKANTKNFFAINLLILGNFGLIQNQLPVKKRLFQTKIRK